ncbi:CesT family type III secretion system chaperone [Pleionea sp. CnH1-48]|uniref:CesT family type III secretion system chaperone n=1 Tax=Pleionea sp. CnH1-48 TaxID=2954494 RepID=UPI0020973075|nr:CesT family type III secretion system chaperone [Pleionea sp. CnH1-48]MCO7222895.1 CesT family type III secretion system chaperone [Pleionea sp. CnH1-48]
MTYGNEKIKTWLRQLGQQQHDHFELDNSDKCFLHIDTDLTLIVCAPQASSKVFLTIELMRVPSISRESFFEKALQLNLFQQETHGATLAIDDISNKVVVCYSHDISELSFTDFSNLLNNLATVARKLLEKLEQTDFPHQQWKQPTTFNLQHRV